MTGDPFSGAIQDGRVYGRGTVDDKASLAVILTLLEAMHQAGRTPSANLLIAATVDEEVGATGAPALAAWIQQHGLTIDQLIVAEPTQCGPVYGHKGVVRLEFQIHGKAAHSSQPEMGQNAITAATHVLVALEAERQRLLTLPVETGLGPPTLTVSIIQGGTGINVVPASCHIAIDRRVIAGEEAVAVANALTHLVQQACPLPLTVQPSKQIDAFYQPPETSWVRQLAEWSSREPAVVPYGTNAFAYPGVVRECIVLGPGSIDQAHGAEEWVEISQLIKLAGIYKRWWGIEE
jgi:acetylornithine deacetylase